tara:strand:+ start:624 stop:767 length:144 start_codon:yes stop_codon:yes gene_type:complete
MWKTKYFTTESLAREWIRQNTLDYQMELIFVANGYGVQYKDMRKIWV